tara:strand:+ start:72 stop:305 length:234 start_codon:yes stop_codon:yes gene_type:complete
MKNNDKFKIFLIKLVKAYKYFDDCRTYLEDNEEVCKKSYIDESQIDECLTLIEKGLGWELLSKPERLDLINNKTDER